MKEKINIAELLKDCPKGMKLYSPIFGDVDLDEVRPHLAVVVRTPDNQKEEFLYDGRFGVNGECMLFPSKENRDWNTFQRPFKDGDIAISESGDIHLLRTSNSSYCAFRERWNSKFDPSITIGIKIVRFATEEEKQKLFDAIKANGYKWNPETKTLEKLNSFKSGDVLVSKMGNIVLCDHIDNKQVVHYHCVLDPFGYIMIKNDIGVGKSFHCTLATDAEKQRLFDRLKSEGYKYNPQTNKLEKLIEPKFKVGDWIKSKITQVTYKITDIRGDVYIVYVDMDKFGYHIPFSMEKNYELVSNKFDITTLKPFTKVLVRYNSTERWRIQLFEKYNRELGAKYPFVGLFNNKYSQCVPYEGNEYLLDTTDDCDEYYKTWE